MWADEFSNFLAVKFNTAKRFGLEGCEAFIPGMKACIDALSAGGAEKVIIGMPHRGRLNVLANVVHKPLETIFAEMQGIAPLPDGELNWQENSGDVKYHLGTTYTRRMPSGKEMTVEILANPSHLECVNPVVMGKARAE
jgi:2-oxoglutarate dehydrogenase E1 component